MLRSTVRDATLLLSMALAVSACGSDDSTSSGNPGDKTKGCSATLAPSADNVAALQGALIDAKAGDTICLKAGTYTFDKIVTMNGTADVTLKGIGTSRDEVILDFSQESSGDDAVSVQADGFTVADLTVKDPPGDGVK